jgi:trehalose 6-phosphate phosphatase
MSGNPGRTGTAAPEPNRRRTDAADPDGPVARAAAAAAALADHRPLLVVCDFDGTIAPLDADPTAPAILPGARHALRRLARVARRRPECLALVILSGRTALDVAGRVRIGSVTYLGDHGIEEGTLPAGVAAERLRVSHHPSLNGHRASARRIGETVGSLLADAAWLFVEPKGPSVAFHYRAADDAEAARAALLAALVDAHAGLPSELREPTFVRVEGRRIVELRPAGTPMKGASVQRLIERHRARGAIVLGDDRSDVEAFAAIAAARAAGRLDGALAVGVQSRFETPAELIAAADHVLPSPAASAVVLRALATALERREPRRAC